MKEKAKKLIHTIHQLEHIKDSILSHKDNALVELDQFPIGICIVDREGIYVKVNTTYAETYGYQKQEMLGNSFVMVEKEEEREKSFADHQQLLRNNYNDKGIVAEEVRKDGDLIPVAYISCNIYRLSGEAERMYLVANISDIDETQAQVDEAVTAIYGKVEDLENKLRSQELAENIFMHDLKKPVKNIQGICHILMSGQLEEDEMKDWVQNIFDITQKIIRETETNQGISRMERGIYNPKLSEIDLMQILENMRMELTPILDSKQLKLKLDFAEYTKLKGHNCLLGEALFIEKMLSNLINNAVEASPENSTVKVDSVIEHGWLHINIHNKGQVPEAIRERFFEKYATAGKSRGTGLGTYIAKLIADSMKGDISLNTSAEEGTTVTISLPMSECHTQAA